MPLNVSVVSAPARLIRQRRPGIIGASGSIAVAYRNPRRSARSIDNPPWPTYNPARLAPDEGSPMTPRDQRFRKTDRLRLRTDFAAVLAAKCSVADEVLVVYVARNDRAWSRLGISVGKRIGNAAERNYVRRRIREAFRRNKPDLPAGVDIVCVARSAAKDRRRNVVHSIVTLAHRAERRRVARDRRSIG